MPATPYRMPSHASMPALTQTAHDRTARCSVKISKLCVEISKLSVAGAGNARAVVSLSQVEIFSKFRFLRSKFRRRNFSDPSSVLRLLRHGGRLAVPASQRHGMPGGIVTGSLCRPVPVFYPGPPRGPPPPGRGGLDKNKDLRVAPTLLPENPAQMHVSCP